MSHDERDRKLRVYLNRSRTAKIPKDAPRSVWSEFYKHWYPAVVTARQLAVVVWKGWSFAHLHNGRKNKQHWAEAGYVALDFDTEDERSTLDYLSKQALIEHFASFAYTTPSHAPTAPRARVLWVFDTPITDLDEYEEFYRAMLYQFDWADQSTKDVTRFFYGSPGCEVWDNWSVLPTVTCQQILDEYRENHDEPDPPPTVRMNHDEVSERFLEIAAENLLDNVRQAQDGEKHYTLNRIAYVFGGYVSGGYYSEGDAEQLLRGVVSELDNVRSKQSAYQTIKDGLRAGQNAPLSFEVEQARRPGDVL